jgi:hypothetical protein
MDLGLYMRVVWRFKFIVAAGFMAAIGLVVLATFHVSFAGGGAPKLSYRKPQLFRSNATLFVTQPGFPWGSTITQYLPGNITTGKPSVPVADPNRLSSLTALYAQIATSDPLGVLDVPPDSKVERVSVTALPAPAYSNPAILPLIDIQAIAQSPLGAKRLAGHAAAAFHAWLDRQQNESKIPTSQRVTMQVINSGTKPVVAVGRSKTLPGLIFITVISATFGLVFVLENLRPRVRTIPQAEPAESATANTPRLSA